MRMAVLPVTSNVHEMARRNIGGSAIVVELRDRMEGLARWKQEMALQPVVEDIAAMSQRTANWDNAGSNAADPDSIRRSLAEVRNFFAEAVGSHAEWLEPFVGLNEHGNVVFEWWNAERKLTIYVGSQTSEYVSSWGPNIEEQMDAGLLEPGKFENLWSWLRTQSA